MMLTLSDLIRRREEENQSWRFVFIDDSVLKSSNERNQGGFFSKFVHWRVLWTPRSGHWETRDMTDEDGSCGLNKNRGPRFTDSLKATGLVDAIFSKESTLANDIPLQTMCHK